MTRFHRVGARRIGGLALPALLLLAAVGLSGCFTISEVVAPSGPPTPAYEVTVGLQIPEMEPPEADPGFMAVEDSRGVLAVRFPSEWQLVSAAYAGAASGVLTYSPAITAYYEELALPAADGEQEALPGVTLRSKPGYEWWAGYSAAHPDSTTGSLTVTLVFDQGSATGAYQLDFLTGVADSLAPEDPEALGAAWDLGGMALDRPVYTGVPAQGSEPQVFIPEARDFYAAVNEPLSSGGGLFDPDSAEVAATVDFGDGQSEALDLGLLDFALGVWDWQWQHAWQSRGTYTVTVRADDGTTQDEATATVRVGQSPFTDVPDSHRFFRAILDLWRTDVVAGYPDGTFRPEDPVLRAQLAKMVALAFGYHDDELTNPDSPTFKDVLPGDDPYPYDYVEEAANNNLVTGFADDTFRPWEKLTRVQLVRVIVRSEVLYLREPPAGYPMPFTDVAAADQQYLAIAHYNGLVLGKDSTHFDPYGTATRGHFAQILYNALHVDLASSPEVGETSLQTAAATSELDLPGWLPQP